MPATTPDPLSPKPTTEVGSVKGGALSIVGFVAATALAIVSIMVCLEDKHPVVAMQSAAQAIDKVGAESAPIFVTSPAAEELVWWHGGSYSLKAPWIDAPDSPSYIAIANDPAGLPLASAGGPLIVVEPWAARRYGPESAGSGQPLISHLKKARVSVVPKSGKARACKSWRQGRWFCGPNQWNYVGPQTLVVKGEKVSCMWLHPIKNGELRVAFPDIQRGSLIKGRVALSDEAAGTRGGAPIEFKVEVDGDAVVKRTHANRQGWSVFTTRVKAKDEGAAEVSFSVSASETGRRHFCMMASVEPPGGER